MGTREGARGPSLVCTIQGLGVCMQQRVRQTQGTQDIPRVTTDTYSIVTYYHTAAAFSLYLSPCLGALPALTFGCAYERGGGVCGRFGRWG